MTLLFHLNCRQNWSDLKKKLMDEGYIEVSEKIGQLKMMGRMENPGYFTKMVDKGSKFG